MGQHDSDNTRRDRAEIHSRARLARFDDARRRVDDRLGHFHRFVDHRAAGRLARLAARRLDRHRSADADGGAVLRRTGRDDAESRRQYVYLREAFSPLWGFLYGWTLFLVIQTGTIAAVAVGFARYTGVLIPWVSESNYLIEPIRFGGYAFSLSTAQLVGLVMIALLTFMNTRGLKLGKLVQNVFTTAKTGALIALIVLGIIVGLRSGAGAANFSDFWTVARRLAGRRSGLDRRDRFRPLRRHLRGADQFAFLRRRLEQHHVHRGRGIDPRRNVPLSLAFGTFLVISLYLLANVAYLVTLPFEAIQNAPSDRVASETANVIFPALGATLMAVAIMISTFGCNNGLILAGARAYYAMARDGLFFRAVGELNKPCARVGTCHSGHLGRRFSCCRARSKTDAAGNVPVTEISTAICSTT